MSQKEILRMGAEEFQNWVAYCSLKDEKYKKDLLEKINLEKQHQLSEKARADQLRSFFSGIGKKRVQ